MNIYTYPTPHPFSTQKDFKGMNTAVFPTHRKETSVQKLIDI